MFRATKGENKGHSTGTGANAGLALAFPVSSAHWIWFSEKSES